jgi:hypothetical protein
VVRNKENRKLLQVGRNCFADYVGHKGLLALEFQSLLVAMFGSGDEDFIFPREGGGKLPVTNIRYMIGYAELVCKEQGGWRYNQKDEYGKIAVDGTHRNAARRAQVLSPECDKPIRAALADVSNPIWAEVDKIVEFIQDMDIPESDDFAHNLQNCLNYEVVPDKKASLVAYAGQFVRGVLRKQAFEAKKATMRHVGTVGKREVFQTLTCRKVVSFESAYGTTHIHIFEDKEGNELVWKTGQCVANEGETLTLKATVKEHGMYRDVPQTVISRAKVV